MSTLFLKATRNCPEVEFDFENNAFAIRGESYPENVKEFYGLLLEKLETHFQTLDGANVSFEFAFRYLHSSTARVLANTFDLLEGCANAGNTVNIAWRYETGDDNMKEIGEELGEDFKVAFFRLEAFDPD